MQSRSLTAKIGASTQAIYTHFGGMPGLFETLVSEGFSEVAAYVSAVEDTDDPVADHMCRGWALVDWARANSQLYRLMLGLSGGGLRLHAGLEMTMSGTVANFPEGQAAMEILIRSVERMREAGRILPLDSVVVAGEFLAATHGYVLLDIAGAFGDPDHGLMVIGQLAVHLQVGLGDDAGAAERSLLVAVNRHEHRPAASD